MNETSDRLPTGITQSTEDAGRVSSLNLSPRFEVIGVESRTTQAIQPDCKGQERTSAPLESGRSGMGSEETSDRLPTESSKTSDTLRRKHFEQRLDRLMVRLLLDLATISQVKAAPTEMQAADANALRLPVNAQGKGLTDDPVASLATDYKRAGRIPDQGKRHRLKLQLVRDASRELSGLRYSRKATPDLGTQDGRLHIARHAEKHGTRRAAEAYCSDPDDPKSVERMMRNIRNYRAELQKVNKRK